MPTKYDARLDALESQMGVGVGAERTVIVIVEEGETKEQAIKRCGYDRDDPDIGTIIIVSSVTPPNPSGL